MDAAGVLDDHALFVIGPVVGHQVSQTMTPLPVRVPPEIVPVPAVGRTFTVERRVRWGDTDTVGRLRLDALARYLQDVANDDTRDAVRSSWATSWN